MDNILKYLIQLKADSGNVKAVARETLTELDKVEESARNVGSSIREAFSFGNLKSSLMSIPGMQFLMNPYTIIGAGVGAITKLGSEAEMTSVSFNKLIGDEQKAAETLSQIKEFANYTPYETMDLVESAKQMMSFGVSTEQTVDVLKRLGDISMGDKNKLSGLSLVYSQVASAGKLQGQDFLQFVNAGFNPLQELSQMTGKTMGELKDMMSKGQIGAQAVTAAIEHATNAGGKFYGMSEELAGTTSGKISTLMGQISQMASDAYTAIQPLVNALIDVASWVTQNIDLVATIGAVIGTIAVACNSAAIAMSVYRAATASAIVVQTMLNAVMSMNPIGAIITGISALTAGVIYCWKHFAGFRAFLITTWDVIKKVGEAITQLFSGNIAGAFKTVANAFSSFNKDWAKNYKNENKGADTKESAINGKGSKGIKQPGLVGSDYSNLFESATSGKGSKSKNGKGTKSKTAEAITTGGTRNTSITMNISKFFDNIQVTMMDKTDTTELQTIVVQSLKRALAIATAKDR